MNLNVTDAIDYLAIARDKLKHAYPTVAGSLDDTIHFLMEEETAQRHPDEKGEAWPVHVVVLQFPRDPDTDDPINWNWSTLLDMPNVDFVTGGVMGHILPQDLP